MSRKRFGFTLIEVSLFLAITGLLFVGIIAGTRNSIFQQRYNDTIQSYAEFLRSVYAQTLNVQNASSSGGRSDKVIYGKLITFGESKDLSNNDNTSKKIFVYDVIGDDADDVSASGDALTVLATLGVSPYGEIVGNDSGVDFTSGYTVGSAYSYGVKWGGRLETVDKNDFTGSVLIVRHPGSGTVYTFFSDVAVEVNKRYFEWEVANGGSGGNQPISIAIDGFSGSTKLADILGSMVADEINFCVNPTGEDGQFRRNVRIMKNARNSSGVVLVPMDSSDNKCE